MTNSRGRKIGADERSGVLRPQNLTRFSAQWLEPATDLRDVVDTYWAVQWKLDPGETVTQRIIDHPALTMSIEEGDVPAPFMMTAIRTKAWSREISGAGSVFAIRLRPAGIAVITDFQPSLLAPETEITLEVDTRAHRVLREIGARSSVDDRVLQADNLIREFLAERPLTRSQRLANSAVDALVASPRVRTGREVAAELAVSERTLQRALRETVGHGPNEIARRIRLQEVVRRLSQPDTTIAGVAFDLNYVDQAHLTNEFRSVSGVTPGQYLAELSRARTELVRPLG
ncbi:helix-turn-helix transcriptional regulator [Salinibacterium sp. NG253]|uniref:helix-turn-helix transcriptional regulator n=1 Tax=Salinibacterium sp. NG253 TaxID=2792039 RepID=UPI0018CDF553|nr:helix-turn-helix transcriptional regulator [Salinibacterium sp. NG253]MBH0117303.1 helix-turn-helix transcriptional regulator [Salinibacterium sp. NG253]